MLFSAQSLACRRAQRLVFRDAGFTLDAGALLLVTGSNGSGKSSLLRVLAGLLPVSKGEIFWLGENVEHDRAAHRARLHYVGHQDAVKAELTVNEMMDYWQALRGRNRSHSRPLEERNLHYALQNFGLNDFQNTPIRYLSAGQKRRLALTRLVIDDAPLWLLDEPTAALDQRGQELLTALVTRHRAKGGIAIIATHHALDFPDAQTFFLRPR